MNKPLSFSFAALLITGSSAFAADGLSKVINYDPSGKTPAAVRADYDGDGVLDQATVQSGGAGKALTWNVALSSGGTLTRSVGQSGNKVLSGCDVDGDRKADMVAVAPNAITYVSSKTGQSQVYATQGDAADFGCWDTDGSGKDAIVATNGNSQAVYRLARALPCSNIKELAKPYLWKSSTSSHIPGGDIRQKFKGSFIGQRNRARIPFRSQVTMYDKNGNAVGYTCKYAQLGTYQFRYYNGTCSSKVRATTQTQRARAVKNTGSPTILLHVQNNECLRLSKGPTTSRQGAVR